MFSLKKIGVSFAIGFTISLIAGIVGGVGFGVLLLRAILSGLFFALVVGGAMILYQKFLLSEESTFDTLQQENTTVRSGSNVDITLGDDDLPDSASAPSFSLGEVVSPSSGNEQREVVSPNAVDEQREVVSDQQTDGSFNLGELNTVAASGLSQVVEKPPDDLSHETLRGGISGVKNAPRDEKSRNATDMELDILPDIEDIVGSDKGTFSSDDGQVIQDTVFSETGEIKPIVPASFSDMGDSRDIAAAIRTILAKDT